MAQTPLNVNISPSDIPHLCLNWDEQDDVDEGAGKEVDNILINGI
jgi:hypothetical protein